MFNHTNTLCCIQGEVKQFISLNTRTPFVAYSLSEYGGGKIVLTHEPTLLLHIIKQFYNSILAYKVTKEHFQYIEHINTVFVRKLCKPRQANTSVTEHKHTVFVRKLCNNNGQANYNRVHLSAVGANFTDIPNSHPDFHSFLRSTLLFE